MDFRTIHARERDAVLDLLAEWLGDRPFFARYFDHDPTFRADLCFVAEDAGRIVSTLQIFEKQVRADGAVLRVAGVGNVFTTEAYRQRGVASELLHLAIAAMAREGFDLSLLFATRLAFYGAHGWRSQLRYFDFVPNLNPDLKPPAGVELTRFAAGDLPEVMALYDRYNRQISGTTVRDERYWRGQLRYAGNPTEDFLLARHRGKLVAYLRATPLYEVYVAIEHAVAPGYEATLAALIARALADQAGEQPGMLMQLSAAPQVAVSLAAHGLGTHRIEDYFWMWRVVSPPLLAERLGMSLAEVGADDFFIRLFPPAASVYWTSDRF